MSLDTTTTSTKHSDAELHRVGDRDHLHPPDSCSFCTRWRTAASLSPTALPISA
jgi:hypothetical protein